MRGERRLTPTLRHASTFCYEMNFSHLRDSFQAVGEQLKSPEGNASQRFEQISKPCSEKMETQSLSSHLFKGNFELDLDKPEAKFFLDVCTCVFHVYKDGSVTHVFVSVMDFLRKYYSFSKVQSVAMAILMPNSMECQSLEAARMAVDNWEALTDSELAKKTHRVVMGVISSGVLSLMGLDFGVDSLEQYLHTRPSRVRFNSINDMAHSICELLLSFVEVGYECFVESSLRPILCRDRHSRVWIKECEEMVRRLETSPTDINFDPSMCLAQVDNLLARGGPLMSSNNQVLSIYWKDLSQRRSALVANHNISNSRKAPFSLLIHGRPGIGKTSIMNILASHFHKVMVKEGLDPLLEWDPKRHMYTRNPDDDFFSGYQGAVHWCMVLDDLAKESATQVKNGQATSIKDVITIINTVGVCTNQAELSKKGTVPLLPKLVLASTNTKHLNARLAVAEPAAVLRRFPFVITPYLKSEYVDPDTQTMKKLDVLVFDAWEFDVELFCQTEHSYEYKMLYERCSMGELQKFLAQKIVEHYKSATMMLRSMAPDNEDLCKHGIMLKYCPECDNVVEFESYETQFWRRFKPRKLTLRERFMAGLAYYSGRYAPYWAYERTVQTLGMYHPAVTSGVNDIFMVSMPHGAYAVQCAFTCILSLSFVWFISRMLGAIGMQCQSTVSTTETKGNIWSCLKRTANSNFSLPNTSRKGNFDELKRSLEKSMVRLVVKQGETNLEVSALYLKNGWYATVGHIFPSGEEPLKCVVHFGQSYGKSSPVYPFILDRTNIKMLGDDLAMFRTSSIIPRKEMWNFLPDNVDEVGRDCISINYIRGIIDEGRVETSEMVRSNNYHHDGSVITGTFMRGWRLDRKPVQGDCGSVVMSETNGKYYISGLHCAGTSVSMYPTKGYKLLCTQIAKSKFEAYINDESAFTMSGYSKPEAIEKGSKRSGKLGEPHYKGVHHWVSTSSSMLGSYPGRVRSSSQVADTLAREHVEKAFGRKFEYGPPLMVPRQNKAGQWLNPFTIAAGAQGSIPGHFNEVDVEYVARGYLSDLLQDKSWLKDVGVVSLDVAVNGISGDPWINRLPMSTSGGFYFPGAKKKYFTQLDEETYVPNEEVLKMVDAIEEKYILGKRANILFNGTLKDEATKLEKVRLGKTRVFTACDVAFSIVMRKQYLKITKAFMMNNFITECAVGMNCYSQDWGKLYGYLTVFGEERIIAGDFSNYDKRMPAIFIRAAFWILDQCRSRLQNISQKNYMIGRGIATDVSFPITNLNGDVFQFAGGNSSGHPLTVIVNSIVNSLYMRFAYYNMGFPLDFFRHDVKLMTLGDDNIMGSGNNKFNHTSIQKVLARHGIPYTMADKESETQPFVHISRADFLKRTFRMNEIRIVGPLALKSIFKSLCFYVQRDNISKYEHFAQCYLAARREWSLHGKDIFENCVTKMETIVELDDVSRVQDFFIPAHYYSYEQTLDWVLGLSDEKGKE